MKCIRSILRIKKELHRLAPDLRVGLIPTMGALHEGHKSLIQKAVRNCDYVVVSIFVNPLQFGPNEDYKKYPKHLTRDLERCERWGVDAVFAPDAKSVLASKHLKKHHSGYMGKVLCGKYRPGHFDGVLSIVMFLFDVINPNEVYFGLKDYQQYILLKNWCDKYREGLPVFVAVPTVRGRSGLALSSRNSYLSSTERERASMIFQCLEQGKKSLIRQVPIRTVVAKVGRDIEDATGFFVEYVDCVSSSTLRRVYGKKKGKRKSLVLAVAVRTPNARLIDNVLV